MTTSASGDVAVTSRHPRTRDARSGVLRWGAAVIWTLLVIVPVDYYRVPTAIAFGLRAALLGSALAAVGILVAGLRERRSVVVFLVLVLVAEAVAGGAASGWELFAAIVLGTAVGVSVPWSVRLLGVLALTLIALFVLDWTAHTSIESAIWGAPFNVTYASTSYRARGFIGQPVPAAFFEVAAASLLALRGRTHVVLRVGWIVVAIASVYLTGTRSAWFALAPLLILLCVRALRSLRRSTLPLLPISAAGALAAVVGLLVIESDVLTAGRALDFGALAGSYSLVNRSSAFTVLIARGPCDVECWALGSGVRSLQTQLSVSSTTGYSTVDDFFVTVLWDLGIVGTVLLAAVLISAAFGALRAESASNAAASGALLVLLVGAFFFDLLYTRSCALLAGLLIGIAIRPTLDARAGTPELDLSLGRRLT